MALKIVRAAQQQRASMHDAVHHETQGSGALSQKNVKVVWHDRVREEPKAGKARSRDDLVGDASSQGFRKPGLMTLGASCDMEDTAGRMQSIGSGHAAESAERQGAKMAR